MCVVNAEHIPVPRTSATYRCRIQVPYTDATYRCHVHVPRTGATHRCHAQVPHTGATYRCRVQVYTIYSNNLRVQVYTIYSNNLPKFIRIHILKSLKYGNLYFTDAFILKNVLFSVGRNVRILRSNPIDFHKLE